MKWSNKNNLLLIIAVTVVHKMETVWTINNLDAEWRRNSMLCCKHLKQSRLPLKITWVATAEPAASSEFLEKKEKKRHTVPRRRYVKNKRLRNFPPDKVHETPNNINTNFIHFVWEFIDPIGCSASETEQKKRNTAHGVQQSKFTEAISFLNLVAQFGAWVGLDWLLTAIR